MKPFSLQICHIEKDGELHAVTIAYDADILPDLERTIGEAPRLFAGDTYQLEIKVPTNTRLCDACGERPWANKIISGVTQALEMLVCDECLAVLRGHRESDDRDSMSVTEQSARKFYEEARVQSFSREAMSALDRYAQSARAFIGDLLALLERERRDHREQLSVERQRLERVNKDVTLYQNGLKYFLQTKEAGR